jgi:hypothetical protein
VGGGVVMFVALLAGVNVLALQRMLGHKSAKITLDTYADLFDDDLDAVAVTLHARYQREGVPVGRFGAAAGRRALAGHHAPPPPRAAAAWASRRKRR